MHTKYSTRVNLVIYNRFGHLLIVDWCFMWKIIGEFIDYLVFHYSLATDVCSFIFTLFGAFGLVWVMPKFAYELLKYWQGWFYCTKQLRCGKPCLCASFAVYLQNKVFDGVKHPTFCNQRAYFAVFVMGTLGNILSISFADFIDSVSLWFVFYEKGL